MVMKHDEQQQVDIQILLAGRELFSTIQPRERLP